MERRPGQEGIRSHGMDGERRNGRNRQEGGINQGMERKIKEMKGARK
jgi:hypothetical protein